MWTAKTNFSSLVRCLEKALILLALSAFFWHRAEASIDPKLKSVREKDLAVALAHTSLHLIKGSEGTAGGFLPKDWYDTLAKAYARTPVGDALLEESRYEDWQLVSLRLAPCEPLGLSPSHDIANYCWPEVRLIWQPILRKQFHNGRYLEAAADDRAIHAIFPLRSERFLPPAAAREVQTYLSKIAAYTVPTKVFAPLTAGELARFSELRDQVSSRLLEAALALRSPQFETRAYEGIGLRPEYVLDQNEALPLRDRLLRFLSSFAQVSDLGKLTSFSLPPGRDPVTSDEWIFLSFVGKQGRIEQQDITLHAISDGRQLGPALNHQRGSMSRDDEAFYEMSGQDQLEMAASIMLWVSDRRTMLPILSDRTQRLVPNTSCVSCHKLNQTRFDFHNFSYLDDQEITVAPRVIRDLELDRKWIESRP